MNDEDWLKSVSEKMRGCVVCRDPDLPRLESLLALITKHGVKVPQCKIYLRMCEISPQFKNRVGLTSLRKHFAVCCEGGRNSDGRLGMAPEKEQEQRTKRKSKD